MAAETYRFDHYELDTAQFQLRRDGEPVHIEPRVLDLLHHLIVCRDRVVSKDELLDVVWGDRFVSEAALSTALRTARIAVGDSGSEQRLLRTVHRRGYQFVADVTATVGDTDSADEPPSGATASMIILAVGRALIAGPTRTRRRQSRRGP